MAAADEIVEDKKVEEVNPLGLSDADFLNTPAPDAPAVVVTEPVVEPVVGAETVVAKTDAEVTAEAAAKTEAKTEPSEDDATVLAAAEAIKIGKKVEPKDETKPETKTVPKDGEPAAAELTDAEKEAAAAAALIEAKPVDHEAFYKQIMTPFKANGKTIELKTPEEAVQLMQMGANYTRKMQELVPHRKVLTMLQNNGLLDENKLSFLIDLDKKDPEAIKKLIKDSGVDPLEIDANVEPAYLEGNHRVTDEEVNFRSTLDELGSTEEGKATLQAINTRWDQASKETLWKNPETMAVIHAQRDVGIYDRIVAEMDRQTTLGTLPPGTPFLKGYKIVGDELTAANAFQDLKDKFHKVDTPVQETKVVEEPKVVATRVGAPKASVKNDDAASAALSSRSTSSTAKEFVNPLAMSDADFLKLNQFNGRV
jgi:hypothetical protein